MYSLREVLIPDKSFLKKLFFIAIPIALQNMSSSILAIIDVAIIKKLGENAISSVSLAGQFAFITNLITFGFTSGASVFLSRYFAAEDEDGVKKTFIITTMLVFLVNLFVAIFAFFTPGIVMSIFTDQPELIESGSKYLVIAALSYLLHGISSSFFALFRSDKKAHYSMGITIMSLSLKTLLNYILICGYGNIPSYGIQGAAISTLISRIVEFLICIVLYIKFIDKKYHLKIQDIKWLNKDNFTSFIRNTYHIVLNESFWGIGLASFNIIFGRMGAISVSALSIAKTLEELFNAFFYGIGIGAVIILGNDIGKKRYDCAKLNAYRLAIIGLEMGIFIMIGMLTINNSFVETFFGSLTPETKHLAKIIIAIFALYMPFRSLASVLIMGVMRAGGDSKKAMFYDVLPIYFISLPLGFLLSFLFELPIYVVLPVMYSKRIVKCVFAVKRLFSGKWLNITA